MILTWEGDNGTWVATSADVAAWLGYPVGHFGGGFIAGRWNGADTRHVHGTLAEAAEAAATIPDRTVERANPSNMLAEHLGRLESGD